MLDLALSIDAAADNSVNSASSAFPEHSRCVGEFFTCDAWLADLSARLDVPALCASHVREGGVGAHCVSDSTLYIVGIGS